MTGMELYVKFMFTLAVGLAGVGLVMKVLLETVLREWDPVLHAVRWWRRAAVARAGSGSVRAEDILSELENRRHGRRAPGPAAGSLERRREALRHLREADERLASPEVAEAV